MADLASIKNILKKLKPELSSKFHVQNIGLFGSIVRDDVTDSSDVDIIVDFSRPVGIEFVDLAIYLENKLARKIDIVSRNGIKEKYFQAIQGEIIYV